MTPARERVRVLRVIGRLNVGGPAIHTSLLTQRLNRNRFETCLVAGQPDATEGDYLDLMAQRLEGWLCILPELGREIRLRNDLRCIDRLTHLMQAYRPHIVHTHAAKAGTVGRLAAWACNVPVVVHTYHGHVLRGYFTPTKERVFQAIERGLSHVSDELVAVSPRVRSELLEMGIGQADRFSVVPLGFDLERFTSCAARRGELRQELAQPAATRLVGIVARLVPIKAHELFFAAAHRLHARLPNVHFVVVGDGERRQELETLVTQNGLRAVTHFLGWRADLDRIYADLDVVVLTSRNEGSPVALIEGMASARPVVATSVGGVPDVVSHGQTGWLVPSGDEAALAEAIAAALADQAESARVARAGQEHVVGAYGAERLVRNVEDLYERLLGGGR